MERRFRAILRERHYDAAHARGDPGPITPVAAADRLTMGRFFEESGITADASRGSMSNWMPR